MKSIIIISIIFGLISYVCISQEIFNSKVVIYFNNFVDLVVTQFFSNVNSSTKIVRNDISQEKLYTSDELSKFVGDDGKLYLSILGQVFDVTKGKKYYGPGEAYHGFTGRDASKAFITGDFSVSGLTDDLADLSLSELSGLQDWLNLYKKDYVYKGKLIGKFYDETGMPTKYLDEIHLKFKKSADVNQLNEKNNRKYPPCNIEWSQDKGSRVWCSSKSGGIKRDWIGVPRKIYLPGWSDYRCACIRNTDSTSAIADSKIKLYDNCDPDSESCFVGQ